MLAAQWGDYGLPPEESSFAMHAIVAHHYFEGASYPVGGAGRIAETIAPVIERSGGKSRGQRRGLRDFAETEQGHWRTHG